MSSSQMTVSEVTVDQHLHAGNLEAAFEVFNKLSNSLNESYRDLEARVSELNIELAQVRNERTRELAEKEKLANRLSSLLSVLPGGVVVVDPLQNICEENPLARDLLANGQSLLGRNWNALIEDAVKENVDGGRELQLENGRRISLSDRVLDAEGNQVILFTDVTELCSLQEWVNREKRLTALGEMSARLAHQLRTPLSSALLYMSHFGQRGHRFSQPSDKSRIVEKVIDRLQHIESLIDGMLMFVRGDTRSSSQFSAQTLIAELLTTLNPGVSRKGGTIKTALPDEVINITGNREALLSGLINIVENSIELASQPAIEVELVQRASHLEFLISDNGPGIDKNIVDKIFDPFFTTRSGGTGLGLAIAAVIAREHGGDVLATNLASGGTRFCFRISTVESAAYAESNDQLNLNTV